MNDKTKQLAEQAGMSYFKYLSEKSLEQAERFAELIRADERKACKKLCDEIEASMFEEYKRNRDPHFGSGSDAALLCAEAIRARGEA